VLVLHSQEAGNIKIGEERKNLLEFLARGGGIAVIHAGAVSRDPAWFSSIVGGSWNHERPTKWLEAPMHLYFTDRENPITADMANFAIDDEIYYRHGHPSRGPHSSPGLIHRSHATPVAGATRKLRHALPRPWPRRRA